MRVGPTVRHQRTTYRVTVWFFCDYKTINIPKKQCRNSRFLEHWRPHRTRWRFPEKRNVYVTKHERRQICKKSTLIKYVYIWRAWTYRSIRLDANSAYRCLLLLLIQILTSNQLSEITKRILPISSTSILRMRREVWPTFRRPLGLSQTESQV